VTKLEVKGQLTFLRFDSDLLLYNKVNR